MELAKDSEGKQLYGADVVDSLDPNYQDYVDWYVWETPISEKNLSKISKFRAGSIEVNFTLYEQRDTSEVENGQFQGTFGSTSSDTGGDLPDPDLYVANDYFTCDGGEDGLGYDSPSTGESYIFGENVFLLDDEGVKSWESGTIYEYIDNTDNDGISVSGGSTFKQISISPTTEGNIVTSLANLQGRMTDVEENKVDEDLSGNYDQVVDLRSQDKLSLCHSLCLHVSGHLLEDFSHLTVFFLVFIIRKNSR